MKRFLALTLLLVAVLSAGVCFAQQVPNDGVIAQGKTYQMSGAAAVDTLHSTATKASGVAATKWRGPIPIYKARGTGAWQQYAASMPNRYFLYARKPFYFKAIFPNGDSTGVYSTNVDTTIINPKFLAQVVYPCTYTLNQPIAQLRLDSTASDTLYVVPLVTK